MKYIRNISDEQNKVGDTDNVFRLNLFEDDKLFDFGENNLTVNVANSSGYILSLTPKKETGNTVIDLDFNDAPLKSLTPDNYLLEVEVKFSDGTTATFPTKGGMPFTVNGNLKETKGTLVPTVTFDNVLDAVDKKIAVYMDTVKVGPAGPIGPAGNVDTSHDNTFTGVNAFTKPIDGALKTRPATFTDFATVAADMITYSGFWFVGALTANAPVAGMTAYDVEVIPSNVKTSGVIRVNDFKNNLSYTSNVLNSTLSGWKITTDDSKVVHNTGTETVAGDKTFTGRIIASLPIIGRTDYLIIGQDTSNDFNNITSFGKYRGSGAFLNAPVPTSYQYVLYVDAQSSFIHQTAIRFIPGKSLIYTRSYVNSAWTTWVLINNDDTVVHNTGTETINGDKTFLSGNYGLRVTKAGIQKTSDNGVTWTNI
ncbi:pyocin knob domain-containing protein [Leuconostoc lactis]